MSEGSLVKIEVAPAFVVATVMCEKVGQREAQVIECEVRAMAGQRQWKVLIDVSNVGMLASMGLGSLVSLHKAAGEGGGRVVIFGMRNELASLLKVTHLDKVLKIVKTRDEAAKALA